jgi:hypothetical protein
MLEHRCPTLLLAMTLPEALDTTRIRRVMGLAFPRVLDLTAVAALAAWVVAPTGWGNMRYSLAAALGGGVPGGSNSR